MSNLCYFISVSEMKSRLMRSLLAKQAEASTVASGMHFCGGRSCHPVLDNGVDTPVTTEQTGREHHKGGQEGEMSRAVSDEQHASE